MAFPEQVTVVIEVPRGGWVKRGADGGVDYVSPVPCPFNYGSVVGHAGADGDPLDAVVLGPSLAHGDTVTVPVRAVVRFVDAGEVDDKLVCAAAPLRPADRVLVTGFFVAYGRAKAVAHRLRGRPGATRYLGWEVR
ncbi:MAG: inorganic diphosphatase [Myxococcota bacterium]